MSNLDVAVSSFWQLARHWNQGQKAKLELSCEGGSLHMQLSAVLGHPEQPHFPHPPPAHPPPPVHPSTPPVQPKQKKKSPSKMRRQERRHLEASKSKENNMILREASEKDTPNSKTSDEEDSLNVKTSEKTAPIKSYFNCDQCTFKGVSKNEVKQHTLVKHKIPQLDGQGGLEDQDRDCEWSLCPLCYDEDNYFASENGLGTHLMNNHEPDDVFHSFGNPWISEQIQCVHRRLQQRWENYLEQKCDSSFCSKENESHKRIECEGSPYV